MKSIVIFASGNGSNAENIAREFAGSADIRVTAVFCNNPKAGVIQRMQQFGIPVHLFDRKEFTNKETFLPLLERYHPDLIVLAGFLWLIPGYLVEHYSGKILNIHPALLPKFGGKGMYGHHVHEAVLESGEKEHGITIHFVDREYDKGPMLFQAKFEIGPGEDLESVSKKISSLEMQYFPEAIRRVLTR